jgi:hypothetical protein
MRKALSIAGRVLLAVLALLVVTATLVPLILDLTQTGPPSLGPGATVDTELTTPSSLVCTQGGPSQQAHLLVVVRKFDPRASVLTAALWLCLPLDAAQNLETMARNAPATFRDQNGYTQPLPKYANTPVVVSFVAIDPRIGSIVTTSTLTTPIRKLITAGNGGPRSPTFGFVPLGTLSLPVASAPERYPLDWYAINGQFSIYFPRADVGVPRPPENGRSVPEPLLPADVTVATDPEISPLTLHASTAASSVYGNGSGLVNLRLVRPLKTWGFVFVVSVIPFILSVLLLVVLRSQAPTTKRWLRPEAFLGIAAVLLAVLPIRLVLVPSDVSSLTFVDYLLGFEMAFLVAVVCSALALGRG